MRPRVITIGNHSPNVAQLLGALTVKSEVMIIYSTEQVAKPNLELFRLTLREFGSTRGFFDVDGTKKQVKFLEFWFGKSIVRQSYRTGFDCNSFESGIIEAAIRKSDSHLWLCWGGCSERTNVSNFRLREEAGYPCIHIEQFNDECDFFVSIDRDLEPEQELIIVVAERLLDAGLRLERILRQQLELNSGSSIKA